MQRAILKDGLVFCHRCNGYAQSARDCGVCEGKGLLPRQRFGVRNGLPQNLPENSSTQFCNGMPVEWNERKIVRLHQRAEEGEFTQNGQISVFEATISAGKSLQAHDATKVADAIECRMMSVGLPDGATPPDEVMVMPAGLHTITPSQNGKPVQVTVQVDRSTAKVLQAALEAHQATQGGRRPWFNFDHNKQGPASAWPLEFIYRDGPQPGVYARVEWSKAGADAITGKMYRSFSPTFFVDSTAKNPARVSGAPLDMGALVNEPAFKEISPLWCAQPEGCDQNHEGKQAQVMTQEELAALQAALKKLEKENAELRAQATSSANTAAITAKDEEIAQLKQTLGKVQGEITAMNKSRAVAAVMAALAIGAIPAKDEALKAHWTRLIETDPENEKLLKALPGNPALLPLTAGDSGRSAKERIEASNIQITREDAHRVLLAYAQEPDPKKRGALYAADISPRIRKGEDFPLILKPDQLALAAASANTLGTLQTDIVSQRALETLVYEFPFLTKISRNFSGEILKFNQTVDTRTVAIPTVGTYNVDTGYASVAAATTDVPVKLDQHKFVQIDYNNEELASTGRDLFGEQAVGMNYALGENFMIALLSKVTVANFPKATNETVVTQANFSRKGVMAIGRKLTGRKVPRTMRTLLLNGDYYDKLGEDTVVVSAFNNQNAGDSIQSGTLPDVHGFEVDDAYVLPTAENLTGFGCFPSALCMAARIPDDYTKVFPGVTGGALTRVITDAATGLSLLQVLFVDHKLGRAYGRVAFMFGVAVGDNRAGERLVSAATP